MKAFFFCLTLLGPLAGCSASDPAPTPIPPTRLVLPASFPVEVRVTGQGLMDLGARMEATVASALDGQPVVLDPGAGLRETYATTVSRTYGLGTFPRYSRGQGLHRYHFTATVAFDNVTPGGPQPTATSRLKVEFLVNGQVVPFNDQSGVSNGGSSKVELTPSNSAGTNRPRAAAVLYTESL